MNEKTHSPETDGKQEAEVGRKEHGGKVGNVDPARSMGADKEDLVQLAQKQARLNNPLVGKTDEQLEADAVAFCDERLDGQHKELFIKGALLAADTKKSARMNLSQHDMTILEEEETHRWRQPWAVYYVAIISSMAAVVQGMDETVINGAQLFYVKEFGLDITSSRGSAIEGLINSAPYLCCFVFACWLTDPINRLVGRRGCIFWSCVIAGVASIWEAFTYSWYQLFLARLLLGLGIGPKSTTAPVYTAECAPPRIRGALVMQWQMWTAFGIFLGYAMDIIFEPLTTNGWRYMLGSTVVAPIIVCCMIYFGPESPRWYVKKRRYAKAFEAQKRLTRSELQAARDIFRIYVGVQLEQEAQKGRNLIKDLFVVPRVRRATVASGLVMFMQQFCGVNVIAFYSSQVFTNAGFSTKKAFASSLGFGAVNWVFAIPAIYTIDTFGRRNLLLFTFPFLCIFNLMTGFSGFAASGSTANIVLVSLGIYLYGIFYSPGEGPVPFTYSAEAFPLYIRDVGMSWATSVTWGFDFVLSISFPTLLVTFKQQGAFGWYAAWCIIGWVLILLILPETKQLTLEELDQVFSVRTRDHARYQLNAFNNSFQRKVMRRNIPRLPPLYEHENRKLREEA